MFKIRSLSKIKGFIMTALLLGGASLAQGASMQEYSEQEFRKAQSEGKSIMLDFKAEWCSVCKRRDPILKSLLKEEAFNDIVAFSVDYDNSDELKKELNIRRQSTSVVFKGKKEMARSTGQTNKDKLRDMIAKAL